jgi:hypothetical protein
MSGETAFEPNDFPVKPEQTTIVTNKDEAVAIASSPEKANDIARRLNEQAAQEELDRWSA